MPIEEKEIGLGLELGKGNFNNTGLTNDGKLVLLDLEGNLSTESQENKAYRESIEKGNRISLIQLNHNITWSGGVTGLIDGTTSNNVYFSNQNIANKHLEFSFEKDVCITSFTWKQSSATNQGNWSFQIESGGTWVDLVNFIYIQSTQIESFENEIASKKYRFLGINGSSSSGPWQYEIEFKTKPVSTSVVSEQGTWTSGVIDLQHKFKEFKKVALDKVTPEGSQVVAEVRTSSDNINFTEFIATAPDGSFLSPAKRYIEVRLTLYVGHTEVDDIVDLTSEQVVKDKIEKPYYFETNSTGMKITENPEIPMELDDEYTGEGYVYVVELEKDEFITETITKLDIV